MRIGMPSFKPHPAREAFTEGVSGCRQSGVRGHPVGLTALVVTGHLRADPRLPVSYGTRDAEDAERATSLPHQYPSARYQRTVSPASTTEPDATTEVRT